MLNDFGRGTAMRKGSRWTGCWVAVVGLAALGFALGSGALVIAAIVPLAYLAATLLLGTPDPEEQLRVTRRCSTRVPIPGETVSVELEVKNGGPDPIADLRIRDQPPPESAVSSGSPRHGTAVRPGDSTTIEYAIQCPHGTHEFGDVAVRVRNLSGEPVRTATVNPGGDTVLESRIPIDSVSVRDRTAQLVGPVPTDTGGEGLQFHSIRDYRRGDALARIDWRRFARTANLATIQFDEEEAARVVVLLDGRHKSNVAPESDGISAVTTGVYATYHLAGTLLSANHRVGVAALGVQVQSPDIHEGPPGYVEPSAGPSAERRIATLCDAVASQVTDSMSISNPTVGGEKVGPTGMATDGGEAVSSLTSLLPPQAEIIAVSPLLDDGIVRELEALRRQRYPIRVVSPDVTAAESIGARVAAIHRTARIERLQRGDIPIIDWSVDAPLAKVLQREEVV